MSFFFVALAGALAASSMAAAEPDLRVSIDGVKLNKGAVIISIYKDADSWLQRGKAVEVRKLSADQPSILAHFKVPPGTYAVQAFQDENGNDKLDMQWLPPGPVEPWVVSNNAQGSMGPPSFKDAKFEFPGDLTLSLALQQP